MINKVLIMPFIFQKSIYSDFIRSTNGIFSIIAAITVPASLFFYGAIITTSDTVLQKNHIQNIADLSSSSGASAYLYNRRMGKEKAESQQIGNETLIRIFQYHTGKTSAEIADTVDYSVKEEATTIKVNNTVQNQFYATPNMNSLNYSAYSALDIGAAFAQKLQKETYEISYVFDSSGSMSRFLPNGGRASTVLTKTAEKSFDTLISEVPDDRKANLAISQVIYNTGIRYPKKHQESTAFTNSATKLKQDLNKHYNASGATNIYEGLETSIDLLDDYKMPSNLRNNQVIILLSDGRPNRTMRNGRRKAVRSNEVIEEMDRINGLCSGFKQDSFNNIIYTIYFNTYQSDTETETIMRGAFEKCASSKEHAFDAADERGLDEVYTNIINNIRSGGEILDHSKRGIKFRK